MSWIDFVLIFIVLLNVYNGWRRGFVLGLLDLIRWIGGLVLALILYAPLASVLKNFAGVGETWANPLAFILLVAFFGISLYLLGRQIIGQMPPDIHERTFNKILGILPGFATGAILAAIAAAMLFTLPVSNGFQESVRESLLAENLAVYTEEIESALVPIFEDALNETLTRRLTNYPGSEAMVELPFKVSEFEARPDLEAEMLALVNRERKIAGLPPVKADPEMRSVARRHSADMFRRGYFSHYTPEKESPFDRMRRDKVRFRTAGENLAIAPTLKIAHTGLMNSPGHRANILNPQFGRLGIGVLDGGRRGLMITQNFRN